MGVAAAGVVQHKSGRAAACAKVCAGSPRRWRVCSVKPCAGSLSMCPWAWVARCHTRPAPAQTIPPLFDIEWLAGSGYGHPYPVNANSTLCHRRANRPRRVVWAGIMGTWRATPRGQNANESATAWGCPRKPPAKRLHMLPPARYAASITPAAATPITARCPAQHSMCKSGNRPRLSHDIRRFLICKAIVFCNLDRRYT